MGALALAESVMSAFERHYRHDVIFEADRDLAAELRDEARPAIEAMAMALTLGAADDARTLGHHESLALVSLLARRAATLGATPSGADRIVRSIRHAFRECGRPIPAAAIDALSLAALEGYVMGREERVRQEQEERIASELGGRTLVDGVEWLSLVGELESETLDSIVEEFARRLHRRGAKAALVDVSALVGPDRRCAHSVLALDESARMLGVSAVFLAGESWRQPLLDAANELVRVVAEPREALELVLDAVDLRIAAKNRLRALFQ